MALMIVTGAAGLVGSETVKHFCRQGADVIGIDNDQRAQFFGRAASTSAVASRLANSFENYRHHPVDIRDGARLEKLFSGAGKAISSVIHAAAQPSHDWAASAPMVDFEINAVATLQLLELTRKYSPEAAFVFVSTNKVYGDAVNAFSYVERRTRWEISPDHPWFGKGVPETASIDATQHSIFGVSKAAADLMVQEYGRYFGMNTACFRCGCITGSDHSGAQMHGFLSYLVKCARKDRPYTVFGHNGKQVRDNIHGSDLASAFAAFIENPRAGEVYNMGGGPRVNVSVLEAIEICEARSGRPFSYSLQPSSRQGDHIWWLSDTAKFERHYPGWSRSFDLERIFDDLFSVDTGCLQT